jgi:hypothetical protein
MYIKQALHTNYSYKITKGKLYVSDAVNIASLRIWCDDKVSRGLPLSLFRDVDLPAPDEE